jgi:putative flippase GtrA
MIERILRAFVWGCVGTLIGFLVVGIIAIRINTIRYGYDPSIDIDGASEVIAYAIGCPIGFALGAIYGFREGSRMNVKRQYKPPYGHIKRAYEAAILLSLTIGGATAGYLFLGGPSRVLAGFFGLACGRALAVSLFWVHYYFVEGKKRPWQFDLRTAFFVMTLAAVLLGVIAVLLHEK